MKTRPMKPWLDGGTTAYRGGETIMRYCVRLMLSASLLGYATITPAFAQDTPAPDEALSAPDAAASDERDTIPEIVVTAERRTSTEQKTAASISTRDGDDLTRQGRYSLASILENVPGVLGGAAESPGASITGATDNPAAGLTIRGIQSNVGTGGSVTSTAPAAAIYVDGVYSGIGGSYDIERVEVLRGPQGTLYGRSATSGVVAIHTRDPDLSEIGGELLAHAGSYDLLQFSGAVNIPLIEDKLALRVSGNHYQRDGFYAEEGGYRRSTEGRAKLLFEPSDTFSGLVGFAFQDNIANVGGVTIRQNTPNTFTYFPSDHGPGENRFDQYWGEFNLDLGGVSVTYLPAYKTWTQSTVGISRGNIPEFNQVFAVFSDTFLTQELRLNSQGDSALTWQTGLFYYDNKLHDINQLNLHPIGTLAFKSESHKRTRNVGVFGEATYEFSDSTRATAGLRYDYTRVRNDQDYTSRTLVTLSTAGDEGLRTFNNVTYKARIEHNLTPANLIYASVSTGFSPGDVAITTDITGDPVAVELEAQTLTAYEIGSKNRFFDNRLQINGAIYYNDYGGFQTAGINLTPNDPANPTFRTVVAPLKVYGAELELQARPWQDGQIGVNLAYTHARYDGIPAPFEYLFWTDEVPGSVPFQANAWVEQSMELAPEARLSLRADAIYRSSYYASRLTDSEAAEPLVPPVPGDPRLGSRPYAFNSGKVLGNLSATLFLEGGRFSITGYVRNIGDVRYKTGARRTPAFGPFPPTSTVDLSDPRTFGVTGTARF